MTTGPWLTKAQVDANTAKLSATSENVREALSGITATLHLNGQAISTVGNVDGRDVSVDGTKLDGVESAATADQSDAEIKTAYENNADTNAFSDAEETKLDGIEPLADVTDEDNVIAHVGALDHDALLNFLAVEHNKPRCALHYNQATAASADKYQRIGNTQMNSSEGFVMPWAGSIIAHSTNLEITTAAFGDITMEVRIGGSNQSELELEFLSSGGTGVKSGRVTVAGGTVTFVAGDIIQAFANETGTMAWDDSKGTIWVEFDN